MKKTIIGYDETKKMLNKLRNLNESQHRGKILKEQEEEVIRDQKDDFVVVNDVEIKLLSTSKDELELNDKHKDSISNLIDNFKQQVSQTTDFEPGMTVDDRQIRLDGSLKVENNDVRFVYIAGDEEGLYINADMLKLDIHIVPMLEKMVKFQETFKSSMDLIINERKSE